MLYQPSYNSYNPQSLGAMKPIILSLLLFCFLLYNGLFLFREPHLVSFHRTGTSLGIQVAGGNAVGIFAAAIKDGSPAQVAGLRVGDQILSVRKVAMQINEL